MKLTFYEEVSWVVDANRVTLTRLTSDVTISLICFCYVAILITYIKINGIKKKANKIT